MSDKKISQLTASTTPLAGTEVLPVVQGGNTVKVSVDNLTAGKNVPALTYNNVTINRGLANEAASLAIANANALANTTSGIQNTAIGANALRFCTTGSYNVAVGTLCFSGANPMTGLFNTVVGASNAQKISSGGNNVGFGYATISNVATASGNTGLGSIALNLTTGANNTGVGYKAGDTATTGSNNAFFGYNAQPSSVTVSNEYTYGDANVTKHRFVGGDIVIGTAGKGIDFSADGQAAGMTSELLDDYEEGTWTPDQGGGLTVVGAFTSSGVYTKIGRLVVVEAFVAGATSIACTANGNICTNLPFAAAVGINAVGSAFTSNAYHNIYGTATANIVRPALAISTVGGNINFTLSYMTS